MPVHQFVRKPVQHIIHREVAFLARHLRIEQHLQQQVAQFAGQLRPVAIVDGFKDFVSLFQRVGLDGVKGLFAIPRASARSPQPRHDLNRSLESFAGGRHPVQCK